MMPRVTHVHYLKDYQLELTFTTGEIGMIDFSNDVQRFSGVLAVLRDKSIFAQAKVDFESGTLVWPGDLDLDPDVLYARATGANLPKFATTTLVTKEPSPHSA